MHLHPIALYNVEKRVNRMDGVSALRNPIYSLLFFKRKINRSVFWPSGVNLTDAFLFGLA